MATQYSEKQRQAYTAAIKKRIAEGKSHRDACSEVGVPYHTAYRWIHGIKQGSGKKQKTQPKPSNKQPSLVTLPALPRLEVAKNEERLVVLIGAPRDIMATLERLAQV